MIETISTLEFIEYSIVINFFYKTIVELILIRKIERACLAQLVEHRSCKPRVVGSIPVSGLKYN